MEGNMTVANIKKLRVIKEFAPDSMQSFLSALISVEQRFETVRLFIDKRNPPLPSMTFDLKFKLSEMCQAFLSLVKDSHEYTEYVKVAELFKGYFTFLKTDRDNKHALTKGYSRGQNAEIHIFHFFEHFLEIHRLLLKSLFDQYDSIQGKFQKDFVEKSRDGLFMLPEHFAETIKNTSSTTKGGEEETGLA